MQYYARHCYMSSGLWLMNLWAWVLSCSNILPLMMGMQGQNLQNWLRLIKLSYFIVQDYLLHKHSIFHSSNLLQVHEWWHQKIHFHSKTKSCWECLKTQLLESEIWIQQSSSFRLLRGCFSNPGDDEKQFTTVRWPIQGMQFVRMKHRTTRLMQRLGSQPWPQCQQHAIMAK